MGKPHPHGERGEDVAAEYLTRKGYQIRARNTHYRGGEIDIVAYDPIWNELVFIEVKSRSSRMFGWPEEGIGQRKRMRLKLAVGLYLNQFRIPSETAYRFDVIAIEWSDITARVVHYKNVEW